MAIVNDPAFSLGDVITELGLPAASSLSEAFVAAALDPKFDSEYEGAKDRLSNFRNYGAGLPLTATVVPTTVGLPMEIECNGIFSVDWGDGNIIEYDNQTVDVTTIGNVLIYTDGLATIFEVVDNAKELTIHGELYTRDTSVSREINSGRTLEAFRITGNWHNATGFVKLLNGQINLTTVEILSTATQNVTSFELCFWRCSLLTTLPLFDTSAGTDFDLMFEECGELLNLPLYDTSAGTSFERMYSDCVKLICLDGVNTLNQISTTDMFLNTLALQRPSGAEQSTIKGGSNYVNTFPCP